MRESIRDAERVYARAERSRFTSPVIPPRQPSPPRNPAPSPSGYTVPYAPPRVAAWEPNTEPPRRHVPLVPEFDDPLGVNFEPPPPLDLSRDRLLVDTSYPSAAQRLQRYRELSGRGDSSLSRRPTFRGPDTHVGAWAHRRSIFDRYPSLADLSPVRLRPTLREMATATRARHAVVCV